MYVRLGHFMAGGQQCLNYIVNKRTQENLSFSVNKDQYWQLFPLEESKCCTVCWYNSNTMMCADTFLLSLSLPELFSRTSLSPRPPRPLSLPSFLPPSSSLPRSLRTFPCHISSPSSQPLTHISVVSLPVPPSQLSVQFTFPPTPEPPRLPPCQH